MIILAFAVSVRESASIATYAFLSLLCGMADSRRTRSVSVDLLFGVSLLLSLLIELVAFEGILAVLRDVRKTKRWRSKGAISE
jgi:hypothetical protein